MKRYTVLMFALLSFSTTAWAQTTAELDAKTGFGTPLSLAVEYQPNALWVAGAHVGWDLFKRVEGGVRVGANKRWDWFAAAVLVGPTVTNDGDHAWGCGFGLGTCREQKADETLSLDGSIRLRTHFDFGMFLSASGGARQRLISANCAEAEHHPDDNPVFESTCRSRLFPRFGVAVGFEF